MSIEKISANYQYDEETFEVTCDDCGECEVIDGSFDDCREWMKDAEWSSVLKSSEWYNYCVNCKDKPKNQFD